MPPAFVLTPPSTEATFPPTHYAGDTLVSSSSTTSNLIAGVTFPSSSYTVTIQPQPTFSVTMPPPTIPVVAFLTGSVSVQTAPAGTTTIINDETTYTSTYTNAVSRKAHDCEKLFGCGCDCELFGCDGGCGLFGCGGGCGLLGCGGGCGDIIVPWAVSIPGGPPVGPATAALASTASRCSIKTATNCDTLCLADTATSCVASCGQVIDCSASGTETAFTETLAGYDSELPHHPSMYKYTVGVPLL